MPRRRGLFAVLSVVAAFLLAGGIALVAALSGNRPAAGPDWWTDAPWTNGTLNVCADISKGAYYTCPTTLRYRLFGEGTNAPSVAVGRCLFGVETLDLSSTHVLLLFARVPHENYTTEQKQVIRLFMEEGGIVFAFLCECNFDCMDDLLASYGLRLHRQTANASLVGALPQTRRFDIEGTADETGETVQGEWTALVETDSVHPRPVAGCRRVGKGLMVYAPQKMFGRGVNRNLNVNFWTAILTAAARAGGNPSKGPVADQSADDAPVQVRRGRTLVCASEALRKEAQDWSRKLSPQATNDVRVLLCDSKCQDQRLCGKRTFRHLGAFRKDCPTSK